MNYYAVVGSDGRVEQVLKTSVEYHKIDSMPDGGHWLWENGAIREQPKVALSWLDTDAFVDTEIVVSADFDTEETIPIPNKLELSVNDQVVLWNPSTPFEFVEAGIYALVVIGPWPWRSDMVEIEIKVRS